MKDDDKDKTNLVLIEGSKKGKTRAEDGISSFDRRSLKFISMAEKIDDGFLGVKFHVVENEGTRFVVRELENRVVAYVNEDQITSHYLSYAIKQATFDPSTPTRLGEATEIIRKWKYTATPIPEPKKIGFKSEPELCFKRLDFDFDQNDTEFKHPTWDIILNNIEANKSAFMQFIGSIFFEESYNQQYLWMYGSGGDGKGSLLKFLSEILGASCKSMSDDIDSHWTSKLVGARVAYFADCRNYGVTNSGKFMTLTGGDAISINQKYKDPFDIKNVVKFIFASNNKPIIDHVASSIRRIIVVPFRHKKEADIKDSKIFENNLRVEGQEFLRSCISEYLKHCKNHEPIILDDDYCIEDITSEAEADKQEFLDSYFGIEYLEKNEVYVGKENFVYAVRSGIMEKKLRDYFGKRSDTTFFKNWIRDRHGVVYKRGRVNKERHYYYYGIRLLRPDETNRY